MATFALSVAAACASGHTAAPDSGVRTYRSVDEVRSRGTDGEVLVRGRVRSLRVSAGSYTFALAGDTGRIDARARGIPPERMREDVDVVVFGTLTSSTGAAILRVDQVIFFPP